MRITAHELHRALNLSPFDALAAQERMAPEPRPLTRPVMSGTARLAGVLALLYPVDGTPDHLTHLALMRRPDYEGVHGGQISFPGGKREADESFEQCALRETEEELGIPHHTVQLVGKLSPLYVPPSDYQIYPCVGFAAARPAFSPDPDEVAEVVEAPLADLLNDGLKHWRDIDRAGITFHIPYYQIGPHQVWGATAILISELEMRLRAVLQLPSLIQGL